VTAELVSLTQESIHCIKISPRLFVILYRNGNLKLDDYTARLDTELYNDR